MKKRILVYLNVNSLRPIGGPVAVCYFYKVEQDSRNESYFEFLNIGENNHKLHSRETRLLRLPKFISTFYYAIKELYKVYVLLYGDYPIQKIDFNKYDVVHFHSALSLYLNKKQLKDFKGKVILQSHTPQPQRQELITNLPKFVKTIIPNLEEKYEKIDRFAFEYADYIIFPCPEAEEPYLHNWSYYKTIQTKKKDAFRYILTGIPPCIPQRDRKLVRKELEIKDSNFIISYVGRHNEIKGYDSLKRIGNIFLKEHDDTWVVCAGKEQPLRGLNHPRWIEIGWTTDAYSYISAADVFILPNKETYFDIVMLEILSLGQIVIASRTGGNKYFEREGCEGVLLYDNEEEALSLITKVKNMSRKERANLGLKNKEFYQKHLTVAKMYDSYVDLLKDI